MKPDTKPADGAALSLDKVERAHLKDPGDASHTIHRYAPSAGFEGFLQRFWIPVWSVPPGQEAPQRVLQYPVCLLVVSGDYARFYGVVSGLSTTTLTGDGWAVGVMLEPAAGYLIAKRPVAAYTDRFVEVTDVLGRDGVRLVERVRDAMSASPSSTAAHRSAMNAYAEELRPFLPIDAEGRLINRVVAFVERHSDVVRVSQVCEEFDLSARSLQRLVHRRLGLTPKWLIQRRRLHEAAAHLRHGSTSLSELAAMLGYADQPHFIRDFARVTTFTPGQFAAWQASRR